MATQADGDDSLLHDVRLVRGPDGQWTARDLERSLVAQGNSTQDALSALEDVVAAVQGEGGHEPTDEELLELDVDPDIARSQSDELPDPLQ